MDSSFGSPIGLNSPFSPKTRQSITSKRTSLLSNFRNHSKFNVSGRLNQNAQTILKTTLNTADNYGLPLPVLVTETLTFADSAAQISARLSPSGWGWVVCGRKLLVWPYRETRPRDRPTSGTAAPPAPTLTCYELTLPQTDLAHKADLVCVYSTDGNQVPSCIGVSPEGVIRYWSSVGQEGNYWEEEADLRGQECDSLREAQPTGCVLATTTCTVVLVQPVITGGRHGVIAKTLRGRGGLLGGIGRRVSSLFFSAMPSSHASETKLVGIAALPPATSFEDGSQSPRPAPGARVCVVAGLRAQLWGLGAPEGLTAETDLQKTLRDAFLQAHLFPAGDPGLLDVFILDIQPWSVGLLLLISAVNTLRSPQIKYALAHMCVEEGAAGGVGQLLGFVPLAWGAGAVEGMPTQGAVRLMATPTHAYLHMKNTITVVSCIVPNEKPDVIEFSSNGDQILGGGLCFGTPLFFSKSHGVISITPNDSPLNDTSLMDSPIASPRPSDPFDGHLSLYELDPRAVGTSGAPAPELLKAAFLHHIRREHAASRTILASLFPTAGPDGDEEGPDVDTLLDRTLLTVATDLVNDVPANDPRWSQAGVGSGAALGSSGSLQIAPQLGDKRRALTLLLEWARGAGLWARLGGASAGQGRPAPTALLLRELAEKVAAAQALRALQQQAQHQHVVDTVIQQVLSSSSEEEDDMGSSALSPSDLFYKRVTGVGRALIRACHWCVEQEESGCEPPALSALISKVNLVILAVIQEVLKFRQQYSEQFSVSPAASRLRLEHTTWTSNPRAGGLLASLLAQQALSVARARRAGVALRAELKGQGAQLGSAALQLAQERNQSRGASKEYAKIRTGIIQPFVDDEEYEHATTLAEKFHDFDMLVLICEKSNNREKLYHYMEKFENQGFQQCAFRWFMSRGRGGQSALLKAFPRHAAALSHWLARHQPASNWTPHAGSLSEEEDEDNDEGFKDILQKEDNVEGSELLWIHEVRNGRWINAATTLLQLSQIEQQSVHRMNIQASLSKLCALAAEGGGDTQERKMAEVLAAADQRILLKDYHGLPPALLSHHGLAADTMRVLEPRDIVDMYITYPGSGLTEYDYVRALELCSLVLGEVADVRAARCEVAELRRRVWCAALLADSWGARDANDPLQTLQIKMFFRVVDAVHLMDCNLDEYLIPLEDLMTSPELSDLTGDKVFQYIMKFGYEHIYSSQSENIATD